MHKFNAVPYHSASASSRLHAPFTILLLAGTHSFCAESLDFLALGELKTKMLLSSLTKLGKLQVEVSDGHIVGYTLS